MHHAGQLVVLHLLDIVEEWRNELEELLEAWLLSEALQMLFSGFPFDPEDVPILFFRAVRQLIRETGRRRRQISGRLLVCLYKCLATFLRDPVSSVFYDHGFFPFASSDGRICTVIASIIAQQLSRR